MKRILSTVICLCMIISILPLQVVTATENTESTEGTSPEVLEKFGFSLDPNSYDTNALNGVTFNTSDVASDDMRIYIWENNLAPVTNPFVR